MKECTLSFVPLNERDSGFRAVAMAMSPWAMTSSTKWKPKPVEVPVIKKTRGILSEIQVMFESLL